MAVPIGGLVKIIETQSYLNNIISETSFNALFSWREQHVIKISGKCLNKILTMTEQTYVTFDPLLHQVNSSKEHEYRSGLVVTASVSEKLERCEDELI